MSATKSRFVDSTSPKVEALGIVEDEIELPLELVRKKTVIGEGMIKDTWFNPFPSSV